MEGPFLIDWTDEKSHVLLNPRMSEAERRRLEALVPDQPAHVWLATSGTTGAIKLAGLSKRAILASAAAVNRRLDSDSRDVWACPLPTFHVGGLGIHARAFLSGARVEQLAWNPGAFASMQQVTLASLVPAQVTDLVRAGLRAPAKLRAIVVGGGAVSPELYERARGLGWPVLPSYGMTECASQVATALHDSPALVLLDHVEMRSTEDGRLAIRSDAIFSGYATARGFVDPKVDGWFVTEDLGEVSGRMVTVRGRRGEFLKIGGESVDLVRLDEVLAGITPHAALFVVPDERLGCVIGLAVASGDAARIAAEYDAQVMPYERARRVIRVDSIPRTPLGKLMRDALLKMLA